MKDKINIENLFKEKFDSFSLKPDPSVFQGIQSGLNASGAAGGAASSGLSLTAKVAAIVVTSMTVGGSIGYFISNNNTTQILDTNTITPNEIVAENTTPLVQKSNSETPTLKNPITIKEGKVYESKEVPEKRVQEYLGSQESKNNTNNTSVESNVERSTNDGFTKIPKNDSKTVAEGVNNGSSNNNNIAIPDFDNKNEENNTANTANVEPVEIELSVLTNPRKGHAPLEVEFFAQSNAEYFEWSFGDEIYSEAKNPIHIFEKPGKYNVSVTAFIVTTVDGEKIITEETEEVTIEVQPKSRITKVPNIFTPNGDGNNDLFFVEMESISSFTITFVNAQGKVLYKSNNPDFKWDGRDFYGNTVNGTIFYNIEAIGEDGSIIQERRQLYIGREGQ